MTRQYPITGYGATPDAGTLQTKFIQSAIDRCFSDGGGEVVISFIASEYFTAS